MYTYHMLCSNKYETVLQKCFVAWMIDTRQHTWTTGTSVEQLQSFFAGYGQAMFMGKRAFTNVHLPIYHIYPKT